MKQASYMNNEKRLIVTKGLLNKLNIVPRILHLNKKISITAFLVFIELKFKEKIDMRVSLFNTDRDCPLNE